MKIKPGSLSDMILRSLEKAIDGYVRLADFTEHTYIYARAYERPLKKSAVSLALKRLRERGLIDFETNNTGEAILRLSKLANSFINIHDFEATEWDGKYTIVFFDIPEKQKNLRRLLRYKLKQWEFKMAQKSVWVSKRKVWVPLNNLIEDLNLSKWVIILESDRVSSVIM